MDWYPAAASFAAQARGSFFAAPATPMDEDNQVALDSTLSYFEGLVRRGVDGMAVNAHTGRGPFLSTADKLRLIQLSHDLGALTISGMTADDPEDAAAFAAASADAQADALLVFPTMQAREDPVRFLDRLWDASHLPLVLFDLYLAPYQDEAFGLSLQHPAVAGVKSARLHDALACSDRIGQVRRMGKLAITGEDRMFGPSLMWGAEAALVGLGAAAVEITLDVFRSWCAGDLESFVQRSQELDVFASTVFAAPFDGYVQRMLWVAVEEGSIPERHAVDRFGPAFGPAERERVLQVVRGLHAHRGQPRLARADRA